MSHVDDGMLHAYLDGALDEYPPVEAVRVREHLDACDECRSRLEGARAIRDQAASILGVAAPPVDVPPLEELRSHARAQAPARTGGASYLHRLGWVASIALALGTGWMLRGERGAPTDRPLEARVPAEQAGADVRSGSEPVSASGSEEATEAGSDAAGGSMPLPPPVRLGDSGLLPSRTPVPTLRVDLSTPSGAEGSTEVVAEIEAEPPPLPPAPRLADTIGPRIMTPDVLVDATDSGQDGSRRTEPRPSGNGVVTSANVSAPPVGIGGRGGTLQVGDLVEPRTDEIEDDESYSLVVPGLQVLDVRFRGAGVRSEGQVALQRLESGDTLRVIHLPAEIELSTLGTPTGPARQIVVQTASGWIVMQAPVPERELLDLMRRLLSAH
ncbi:MAG: hypothetical protein PVF69_14250 [Gemmatimonadota bacterium]|jgi:hypothetical protein